MNLNRFNRKVHYWASILITAPFLVVLVTGILLQLKKEWSWVQPPTYKGKGDKPEITFEEILAEAKRAHEGIRDWSDIERLDVRPGKGIVKVRSMDGWEIQIDTTTGKAFPKEYRRSDVIEAIHDGSWFHDSAKLWIFLPAAVILLGMGITGLYLFWLPIIVKRRRRKAKRKPPSDDAHPT